MDDNVSWCSMSIRQRIQSRVSAGGKPVGAATHALDKDIRFYLKQYPQLLRSHSGQWVLIQDAKIIGYYRSQLEAVNSGYREFGNTPFLTRQVEKTESFCEFASLSVDG